MRRLIPTFLVLLCVPVVAFATAQVGDVLLLDGETYSIDTNPLRPFLQSNPGLLPVQKECFVSSSANWRGYIATWEVQHGQLFLVDVQMLRCFDEPAEDGSTNGYQSVFSEMFPERKPLLADWFTGNLIIPTGKLVSYVHMGYGSTYKKYLIVTVVEGSVTRTWKAKRKDFVAFRLRQWKAFKQTDEYQQRLAASIADGSTEEEAEDFLFHYLSERYLSIVLENPGTEQKD